MIDDFNRDGKPDIAAANEQSNNVTILLGDGMGNFTEAKGSPFPSGHKPNDISVSDFNGDGKLDLAFANHEEKHLTVLLGDGSGTFSPAPKSPFAIDVRPHTHGVSAGDLNGDGKADLVTDSWGNDQIAILFGDGTGGFKQSAKFLSAGKHPYQRLRVADVNGDKKADIVVTDLDGDNVSILLSDGLGNFTQPANSPFACGDSPFFAAVGDLNKDGRPDLAVVNAPSSTSDRRGKDGLTILLGDGAGNFKIMSGSPFVTGKVPNLLAIGDVNNDGVNDIGVSYFDDNSLTVFFMSDKGMVASNSTIAVGKHPKGIAIRDLNGDGKSDIAVAENGDNDVAVIWGK
ncbi:MAG TPA: VCBS repeat-containing protein [Pyrinomonadaceae bacterium]|nr:VCBS repeat-containing protein [Pyrinomonadaceae bacterium]